MSLQGKLEQRFGLMVPHATENDADNVYPVEHRKVTVTAAELKALNTTAKELVPAPGTNKMLQFLGALLVFKAGSETLSASDNSTIEYDGGTGEAVTGNIADAGLLDQAADTINTVIPIAAVGTLAANGDKNLALCNGANPTGNASNDAYLEVYITYRVHNLS